MAKVLIIEDQEGMSATIKRCVDAISSRVSMDEAIIVTTLAAGKRVIEQIPHPMVVFLDLGLPDSEWMETIKEIPNLERYSPVIIMTGYPEDEVRRRLANPEIEIIHKGPSFWSKVVGAIGRALSRSRSYSVHLDNLSQLDGIIDKLKTINDPK